MSKIREEFVRDYIGQLSVLAPSIEHTYLLEHQWLGDSRQASS